MNPLTRFCRASTSPENRLIINYVNDKNGAVTGNRTRIPRLASSNSTVELPPRFVFVFVFLCDRSGQRESNPHNELGRLRSYRWTMPAKKPPAGIEPAVSCVPNRCPASWAWVAIGGEGGTRTRIDRLQGGGSSFELHPRWSYRPAGCEGIEPSRRSFGGSAVTMTLHPMRSPKAPAHPRRFELPSLDRQSSCVPVAYGRIKEKVQGRRDSNPHLRSNGPITVPAPARVGQGLRYGMMFCH